MLVQVTQEHIAHGVPLEPAECAVALAIRALGVNASVDGSVAFCTKAGGRKITYELSPLVRAWIGRFDNGEPVEPITFIMEPFFRGPLDD